MIQEYRITIPDHKSTNSFIDVLDDTYNKTVSIGFTDNMYQFMACFIIKQEMEQIGVQHPEVNLEKVQKMLDSLDPEMRNLAYNILRPITIYTIDLLSGNYRALENYIIHNRNNITGKII